MIGSLRGCLLARSQSGELLIEVAGVGYRVQAPTVNAELGEGSEVFVHVCHVVREDAQTLFGFGSLEERQMFETLRSARGVGPAVALAILGVHSPDGLRAAVAAGDADALLLVPGVGPKTAARLMMELAGKLEPVDAASASGDGTGASGSVQSAAHSDVRQALASLGFAPDLISRAVAALPDSGDPSTMLRDALRALGED